MHGRINVANSRVATEAEIDPPGVPTIASVIRVSPSRQSRALGDRIRTIVGDDPAVLLGRPGIAVVKEFGIPGAVAIGWTLVRHRFRTDDGEMMAELDDESVFASDDLACDCFDPDIVPTSRFVWDRRALALAVVGRTLLEGVVTGPEWPVADRIEAHRWAEELECILRVRAIDEDDDTLIDDDDHLLLDQAADLALLGNFTLTGLSDLLRVAFDLAGRTRPIVLPADFGFDTVLHAWTQTSLWDTLGLSPEGDPMPLHAARADRIRRPLRPSPAPAVPVPGFFD